MSADGEQKDSKRLVIMGAALLVLLAGLATTTFKHKKSDSAYDKMTVLMHQNLDKGLTHPALYTARQRVEYAEKHSGKASFVYADARYDVGTILLANGEYAKAAEELESALRAAAQKLKRDDPKLAKMYDRLGTAYGSLGKLRPAVAASDAALKGYEAAHAQKGAEYAAALYHRAFIEALLHNCDRSAELVKATGETIKSGRLRKADRVSILESAPLASTECSAQLPSLDAVREG